jgi:hypothetical protein
MASQGLGQQWVLACADDSELALLGLVDQRGDGLDEGGGGEPDLGLVEKEPTLWVPIGAAGRVAGAGLKDVAGDAVPLVATPLVEVLVFLGRRGRVVAIGELELAQPPGDGVMEASRHGLAVGELVASMGAAHRADHIVIAGIADAFAVDVAAVMEEDPLP